MAVEIQAAHRGEATLITKDEHLRATTLEKLTNVPAHVRKDREVTAGNASGINDVARAILLASAKAVKEHNLVPPPPSVFQLVQGCATDCGRWSHCASALVKAWRWRCTAADLNNALRTLKSSISL